MKKEKVEPQNTEQAESRQGVLSLMQFMTRPKQHGRMYKRPEYASTGLRINKCTAGETIETKVARAIKGGEKIKDTAPLIFQERNAGINEATNIRTDRWEIAVDATDKISKSFSARREGKADLTKPDDQKDGKAEPTGGSKTPTDN